MDEEQEKEDVEYGEMLEDKSEELSHSGDDVIIRGGGVKGGWSEGWNESRLEVALMF